MVETFQIDLFPSRVMGFDINSVVDGEHVSDIVWDIVSKSKNTEHGLLENGASIFDNFYSMCDDPRLVTLKSTLVKYANTYCSSVGFPEVEMSNSWANISREGTNLKEHSHRLAICVCAYYPSLPAGSANLFMSNTGLKNLEDQRNFFHKPESEYLATQAPTDYNQLNYEVQLKEGWVYFFPGYQKHWAPTNTTSERIVVSANFNSVGNFNRK